MVYFAFCVFGFVFIRMRSWESWISEFCESKTEVSTQTINEWRKSKRSVVMLRRQHWPSSIYYNTNFVLISTKKIFVFYLHFIFLLNYILFIIQNNLFFFYCSEHKECFFITVIYNLYCVFLQVKTRGLPADVAEPIRVIDIKGKVF